MNFKADPEKITTGELLDAEGDVRAMNALMSRFVVDPAGNPIPQDEAIKMLRALTFFENAKAQQDFLASLFRENGKLMHWN